MVGTWSTVRQLHSIEVMQKNQHMTTTSRGAPNLLRVEKRALNAPHNALRQTVSAKPKRIMN